MPFFSAECPSIQLGLLRSAAEREGFSTDTFHLNLELAAQLTPPIYEEFCQHRGRMTGEWLFAKAAFGDAPTCNDQAYFDAFSDEIVALTKKVGRNVSYISQLRHEILPAFIDNCLGMSQWNRYGVVGFTSTFQQNVASLALARRIKEAHPHVIIIFGGANFEDEMGPEFVRSFPFIDYAVVGEGDIAFPALLQCLTDRQPPEQVDGVVTRQGNKVTFKGQAPATRDLDALPVPIYDEYFERLEQLHLAGKGKLGRRIPIESSRGCWWGEKHHCTFCGLNGLGMKYRVKRPERLLAELSHLSQRHRVTSFEAVDNILDMNYVSEFFSMIEKAKADYTFFYEVKANLNRAQLRALYRGGVRVIQPGIESLSTHVLQLMKKGCTALQNIRLLKWARYYGIKVNWNIIWGFPGETYGDYQQQLSFAKLLSHLDPPGGGRIWLERFSPYYRDRDQFPIHQIRPDASYRYVYPEHVNLDRIAYFFECSIGDTLPDAAHREFEDWRSEWRRRWESDHPDTLFFRRTTDCLFIDDDRGPERRGTYAFHGALASIYAFCSDTMRTVPQVLEHLHGEGGSDSELKAEEVRWSLDEFCRRGLIVGEDGLYLSLALPANPNW